MRLGVTNVFCWPEVRRGAERMIFELSRALHARGHDVTVYSCARTPGRTVEGGVKWVRYRRRRELVWEASADFGRLVLPELLASRLDAVHCHGLRDCVAAIRASKVWHRQRTVFTDLGVPQISGLDLMGPWALRCEQYVVDQVDVYGGMSQHALDALAETYGRQGVLTPGGINLAEMVPATSRTEHPVILFSGAITEPRKGVASLLEAMPAIIKAEPRVELWLSGPGDPSELLAAAAPIVRDHTQLLGLGEAHDQAARYGRAWTTILPSMYDSFGQALLESLACGTPLVGTTHAAVPELVTPGVTGSLCTAGDPASIATACLESIALARLPETAEACREFARPYDWETGLAPRYERFYAGEE